MARGSRVSPESFKARLGDVLGEVADPLEVAGNADRGDDLAQIRRQRLALGDGHDRLLFDIALQNVETLIDGDGGPRQIGVERGERLHRIAQHLLGDAAHLRDLAAKGFKLVVVGSDGMIGHGIRS